MKRLPVDIKLFNENGEMVLKRTSRIEDRLSAFLGGEKTVEWKYGVARVWYNIEADCWNEYTFTTAAEFHRIYLEDTDPDMLRDFLKDGTLDRAFTEKRKSSPKQLAALEVMKLKSPLQLGMKEEERPIAVVGQ